MDELKQAYCGLCKAYYKPNKEHCCECKRLREALETCHVLFSEIRLDYSDPSYECEQGLRTIDLALAHKDGEDGGNDA